MRNFSLFFSPLFSLSLSHTSVSFTNPAGYWTFDLTRIQMVPYSSEVVEFLVGRLRSLTRNAKIVMHHAACLGSRFSEDTIIYTAEDEMCDDDDVTPTSIPAPATLSMTKAQRTQVRMLRWMSSDDFREE